MAVDTEDKRGSAINTGPTTVLPTPDGTIDSGDRAQLAGIYRGLFDGTALPPEVAFERIVHAFARSRYLDVRVQGISL